MSLPDGRGWVSLASFALVLVVLLMIWCDRSLLHDDFFKTIATALIVTAWLGGPVGWAFQATQSGGDLARQNADMVARKLAAGPPATDPSPQGERP